MLKKIILVSALAIVVVISAPNKAYSAYSDGAAIGASFVGGFPSQVGLALTGQFPGVPLMFGLTARFPFDDGYFFGLGLTMDWWGLKIPLLQDSVGIHFYLGPGLALSADFGEHFFNINAGLRVPLGFSFVFAKSWEIFVELAPTVNVLNINNRGVRLIGIAIGYNDNWSAGDFFGFGGQLGFRYWF